MSFDPNIPNESNFVRGASGDLVKMRDNFAHLEPTASGQLGAAGRLSGHDLGTAALAPSGARVALSGAELQLIRTGDGASFEAVLRIPLTSGQAAQFDFPVIVPDPTAAGHAANRGWVLGRDIEEFNNVASGAASGEVLTFDGSTWSGQTSTGGGGASPNLSGAAVTLSGTSGLVSSQVWTVLTWDDQNPLYDVSGFVMSGQGERLTVPAGLGGAYKAAAGAEWDAITSGAVAIRKNGAEFPGMGMVSGTGERVQQCETATVFLAAGDYLEVYAWNEDGVERSVLAGDRTWFHVERRGDLAQPFESQGVSVDLNGSNEFLRSPNGTLSIADQWTVMMWVKRTGSGTSDEFILDTEGTSFQQASAFVWQKEFGVGNQSNLQVSVFDSGGTLFKQGIISGIMASGQWVQVALTFDGSAGGDPLLAYVSGVSGNLSLTTDNTGTMDDPSTRAITIGADPFGSGNAEFRVYQLAIWSSVLSSGEVGDIYNGGNPQAVDLNSNFGSYSSAASLEHWFRLGLDDSADSEIGRDWSESGNGRNVSDAQSNITIGDDVVADAPS